MCFIITNLSEHIANEDIECWKIMTFINSKLQSRFYKDLHLPDQHIWPPVFYDLNTKYHATDIDGTPIDSLRHQYGAVYEGFHSYKFMYTYGGYHRVKCIIPKGTPYFKNNEEYVSLEIIFKEVL